MVNETLAAISNHLLTVTVVLYVVAMVLFGADTAFGRRPPVRRRYPQVHATSSLLEIPVLGSPAVVAQAAQPTLAARPSGRLATAALVATGLGWATQLGSITTRGFAAHRVPWGNMFEFSSALAFVAVTAFLVLVVRRPEGRALGIFVMVPVLLTLGLASTVLYADAGPLVPALKSYWLKIHVSVIITASGVFMVGGVASVMYLMRERWERKGSPPRGIARTFPSAATLDRLQHRIIVFGLPLWTFGVIAGAIWAEAAWGRPWGWDPKETWSFITWVVYAGYLHARATAGWKGRKAAWVALAGFSALTVDYYLVNLVVTGLHSYAGVG